MRTVFREKLSMENQTTEIRQAPVNAEVIPDQNPGGPGSIICLFLCICFL